MWNKCNLVMNYNKSASMCTDTDGSFSGLRLFLVRSGCMKTKDKM